VREDATELGRRSDLASGAPAEIGRRRDIDDAFPARDRVAVPVAVSVELGLRGNAPHPDRIPRIRETHAEWNSRRMPFATPPSKWQ